MTNLIKVTKTQLKAKMKRLEEGKTIQAYLCPSNFYPNIGHPFNMAMNVELGKNGVWDYTLSDYLPLDEIINVFEYHNCDSQLGYRVHYYIEG